MPMNKILNFNRSRLSQGGETLNFNRGELSLCCETLNSNRGELSLFCETLNSNRGELSLFCETLNETRGELSQGGETLNFISGKFSSGDETYCKQIASCLAMTVSKLFAFSLDLINVKVRETYGLKPYEMEFLMSVPRTRGFSRRT